MKKLQELKVKDWVSYKKASLILDEGFTVIHGRNLDRPEKNSSNGAGKSLIVSLLPDLRYGSPPTPLKSKKSWKENFKKETEQTIVMLDDHDNKFNIVKRAASMFLFKNGKDQKIRGKANVEAELEALIPLNEEQFYSLVYLDTKRPPVLQYGTDVQRHAFIEKLYKLDVYDKLGVIVKKDWEKTQRIVQDIEVLDRQLSEKSHGVKDDPRRLKRQQKKLMRKTEVVRKKVADLLAKLQQCRTFITLAQDVDTTTELEVIEHKLKRLRIELKAVSDRRDKAIKDNKKHEAFATIEATRKRLQKELKQYEGVKIDKQVQEKVREDRQLVTRIETTLSNNQAAQDKLVEIDKQIALESVFEEKLKDKYRQQAEQHDSIKLKKQLNKEKVLLRELSDNLKDTEEHFDNHDDQACPICSTALDRDTMLDIVKVKNIRIGKLRSKIKILETMITYVERIEKIAALKETKKQVKAGIEEVESADIVYKRIEQNEILLSQMRKKIMCKGKLQELPELEDCEPIDLEILETDIKKLFQKIESYSRLRDARINLDKLELPFKSIKEAKNTKKEIENALTEYQPLLDRVQEKLNKISINATRAETLSSEVQTLSSQITELKLQSSDHKIKTALRKAFGAKGIRKQRVAEICAALETTFNDYADQIFDFPIRFEIVVSDTKFQILAHRNGGVSDVRRLGGAESRYFSLLTMLTLLKFCPNDMRLDTVVLDEMEANMDIPFKRRYIDICLPKILELVPKVVVVTPQSEKEMYIPKAKVYTVEKKGNVSTLYTNTRL